MRMSEVGFRTESSVTLVLDYQGTSKADLQPNTILPWGRIKVGCRSVQEGRWPPGPLTHPSPFTALAASRSLLIALCIVSILKG